MGNRASMKGVNPKGQGHNSDDASSSPQVSKLDIQSPTSLDVPTTKLDLHKSPSEDGLTEITFKMNTEGSKLTLDDFELLCVIGRGSFGKVLQVKKKDNGKIYAMKILNKKHLIARKQVAHTKTERKVLQSITHPFIVNLIYAFQTEAKLYMVLEFFNGGELFFHLKNQGKFNDERASFYAAQVVLAFEHLHKRNIIYRDLKPENVLLDDQGYVKITDFGLSKEMTSPTELTHTFCGTPEYLAPEVILGNGYGQPIDWWSLGALTFEMLTGLVSIFFYPLKILNYFSPRITMKVLV
jgi:serine/threonine protein kinase